MSYPGYPLPVVLNDQSAAVLPVITADRAIDVARPLEIPEGIRQEYVTANKKVHQDCKSGLPPPQRPVFVPWEGGV